MRKIRKGDDVIVIAGKDKGKRGNVLNVLDNGRVFVDGVNIVKKHKKANPNKGETGGIVFGCDHRMHSGGFCCAQTGAEVMGVGHAIQHQQEGRLLQRLQQAVEKLFIVQLTGKAHGDHALMIAVDQLVEFFTTDLTHLDLGLARRRHDFLQALILPSLQHQNFIDALGSTF